MGTVAHSSELVTRLASKPVIDWCASAPGLDWITAICSRVPMASCPKNLWLWKLVSGRASRDSRL